MIVVRRTGLRATPSPMSAESDYFENPIQVDKGRLVKLEQGPVDIATPWRRPCNLYAAGWGGSEGLPACNLTHDRIWVFALEDAPQSEEHGLGWPGEQKASQSKGIGNSPGEL